MLDGSSTPRSAHLFLAKRLLYQSSVVHGESEFFREENVRGGDHSNGFENRGDDENGLQGALNLTRLPNSKGREVEDDEHRQQTNNHTQRRNQERDCSVVLVIFIGVAVCCLRRACFSCRKKNRGSVSNDV